MKKMGNLMIVAGALLVLYSLFGRFYGAPTLGFGVIHVKASSGLIMSIVLITLGTAINLWEK